MVKISLRCSKNAFFSLKQSEFLQTDFSAPFNWYLFSGPSMIYDNLINFSVTVSITVFITVSITKNESFITLILVGPECPAAFWSKMFLNPGLSLRSFCQSSIPRKRTTPSTSTSNAATATATTSRRKTPGGNKNKTLGFVTGEEAKSVAEFCPSKLFQPGAYVIKLVLSVIYGFA